MNEIDLVLRESQFDTYEAGQTIFQKGDEGKVMYAVKDGEVEILSGDDVLDTVGPGGIFGEMALIDSIVRSARARAKTDCQIVTVDRDRFTSLCGETPSFAIEVMRIMANRLRRATTPILAIRPREGESRHDRSEM